jgi:sensor histidine kinase YesM
MRRNHEIVIPPHLRIPFETGKFVLFYLLWIALMFGLLTLEKRREESERLLGAQKALAEAQLAQLQSQLRPHFLFNALNTVSSLMLTDTARADRVLTQLGDLLRASLRRVQAGPVPLRDELAMLGKYADIMRERFEDRAVLHWEVADDVLDVPVPPMLLQPLLENAFKHGVERSVEPVHISIRIRRGDRMLKLEVHNTGSSMQTPATAGARSADGESGVGLANCRERLRLLYGDAAWLWVIDDLAGGVSATVTLPCPTPAA